MVLLGEQAGGALLSLSTCAAQASATRDYLHSLNQNGETLPDGPVIISPDGLFPSLYRELVRPQCLSSGFGQGQGLSLGPMSVSQ